jgi:hypothetical protein
VHRHAFVLELLHHRRHVDRVPDNDGVRHEIQTQRWRCQLIRAELVWGQQRDESGPALDRSCS